jgi:hypothetical protein
MRAPALLLSALALAACDPAAMADKVGRRAADTVVRPIVVDYVPTGTSETATRCIVDNASADQIKDMIRDTGVEAGPRTIANVLAAAANPAARSCLAAAGIPALRG